MYIKEAGARPRHVTTFTTLHIFHRPLNKKERGDNERREERREERRGRERRREAGADGGEKGKEAGRGALEDGMRGTGGP